MSHEPKSPSLGMISTATRTTATVSPLTPSPLNGSIVANGSPATQSAHSGFAAALRKLAKQAEEPRGKATQPLQQGCLFLTKLFTFWGIDSSSALNLKCFQLSNKSSVWQHY